MKLPKFLFFGLLAFLNACQPAEIPTTFSIQISALNSPVSNSIRGMSVVDSNTIWLSGAKGTVLKSENGGEDWIRLATPDNDSLDFRSVHAFSSTTALIVSAGFPAKSYRTTNCGKNWNLVYENNDSSAFMNSIAFKNELEGIIIGDQINGRHLILRSGNGGLNWEKIGSIDIPEPLAVENGFAASGSCIAISKSGNLFIGLGGEQARIFSSVNGYKWEAITTPLTHGDPYSGIYSVAASGTGKIIAVGGNYINADSSHYPIISLDDGKSWNTTKGKVNGYRSIVTYSKTMNLWVAGGTNGLDMSTDGGTTWTKFSFQDVNTLRFLEGTTKAIGANSKGEIFLFNFLFKKD